MKSRRIGTLEVSAVGLGANNFGTEFFGKCCGPDEAARVIHAALDHGVNFIDTAEEYSVATSMGTGHSEEYIGLALGRRRSEVVIASKFLNSSQEAPDQRGADRIVSALEGTLRRLQTDYVDLYQQHRPDPDTPIEETLEALDRLVREGKVREIGSSNFSGQQITVAHEAGLSRGLVCFASAQNQYNVLDAPRQVGVLEACESQETVLLPYYPLASGLLTGKYSGADTLPADSRLNGDTRIATNMRKRLLSDSRMDKVRQLEAFAKERNHSILELAISWLTSQPIVASVITGASRPEQIIANRNAASWDLTTEEFDAIAAIVGPKANVPNTYLS